MLLVVAENVTLFWLDTPKIAVPVGTAAGVQLALVLKSPVPLRFQVASCAAAGRAAAMSADEASSAARSAVACRRRRGSAWPAVARPRRNPAGESERPTPAPTRHVMAD